MGSKEIGNKDGFVVLANTMAKLYAELGRDEGELEHNLSLIRDGKSGSGLDRSMDGKLGSDVDMRHKAYLASRNTADEKVEHCLYYKAIAAFSVWCSIQHAACGFIREALEAAGKAVGYYRAAEVVQGGDNWTQAFSAAGIAEEEFLKKWGYVK